MCVRARTCGPACRALVPRPRGSCTHNVSIEVFACKRVFCMLRTLAAPRRQLRVLVSYWLVPLFCSKSGRQLVCACQGGGGCQRSHAPTHTSASATEQQSCCSCCDHHLNTYHLITYTAPLSTCPSPPHRTHQHTLQYLLPSLTRALFVSAASGKESGRLLPAARGWTAHIPQSQLFGPVVPSHLNIAQTQPKV